MGPRGLKSHATTSRRHKVWTDRNLDSDDEVRALAAAANFYLFQHFDCSVKIGQAIRDEEAAKIELERAKSQAFETHYAALKLKTDQSGKRASDTAALERARHLAAIDKTVLQAALDWVEKKALRVALQNDIETLRMAANNTKFSARAASGEYRDLGTG